MLAASQRGLERGHCASVRIVDKQDSVSVGGVSNNRSRINVLCLDEDSV
jgi:hypothetical protein